MHDSSREGAPDLVKLHMRCNRSGVTSDPGCYSPRCSAWSDLSRWSWLGPWKKKTHDVPGSLFHWLLGLAPRERRLVRPCQLLTNDVAERVSLFHDSISHSGLAHYLEEEDSASYLLPVTGQSSRPGPPRRRRLGQLESD